MKPEKPKIVRRKPADNEKDATKQSKIVRRKPTHTDKEETPKPRPFQRKPSGSERDEPEKARPFQRKPADSEKEPYKKPRQLQRVSSGADKELPKKSAPVRRRSSKAENDDLIRLNKYIANSGMCSRREADKMIAAGIVSVNGKVVTELGTKVSPMDKVKYADEIINREKPKYLLLNKPKGFITTVDDPENRKTVMNLVAGACKERIYPVGRLDRNTTGLLLFTNDGNIAKKLTHPRYGIKKIYHVEIDKPLTRADFDKIGEGFKLEDDFVRVDAIEYIGDGKDKKQLGIELHSGQNRIVRRIFEHFEYQVVRLDRVYYAGLTKKNLPRGTWRFLDEQEINMLKMISSKP
jgi:23S rRNA pseudouridine2605 synthase